MDAKLSVSWPTVALVAVVLLALWGFAYLDPKIVGTVGAVMLAAAPSVVRKVTGETAKPPVAP